MQVFEEKDTETQFLEPRKGTEAYGPQINRHYALLPGSVPREIATLQRNSLWCMLGIGYCGDETTDP